MSSCATGTVGLPAASAARVVPTITRLHEASNAAAISSAHARRHRDSMSIIGAIQLRKEIEGEWLLILGGVVAILFGIMMFFQPAAGALAVVWMIATFAIIFGIDLIWLAFKLKGFKDRA